MSKKENKSNKKEVIDETNGQKLVEAFSFLLNSVTPEKTKKSKSKKQNYLREYKEPQIEEVVIEEDKGLDVFSSLLGIQESYPEDLPSDVEPQEKRKPKTESKKYLRKYVEPHMDDPTDDVSGKESLEGWIDQKPIKEETQALKALSFLMNGKVPENKDTEDKVEIDKSDSIVENNSNIKNAMDVLSGVSENFLKNLRKGNEEKDREHKLRIERILEKQRN